jgi:hypothetical protein
MHPANRSRERADVTRLWLDEVRARLLQPTPAEIVKQVQRQLEAAPGRWHLCPQRACRRSRRCNPADPLCIPQVLSPPQQAETLAKLNRALEREGR